MQNPSILNLQQVKQFQLRRAQITKGSPLLKNTQLQLASNIRNQSLLSDQPQHLKKPEENEPQTHLYNPFERRLQKQNQLDKDNIFQLKLNNEHTLNQLNQMNMQLIQKNKILNSKLKQQQKINENCMEQIKKLQEANQAFEEQIQELETKVSKHKLKKKELKDKNAQLQQELEELQEKVNSNQGDENHPPLTRQQIYQIMQYLYQGEQQYENFQEYQDQEIDPDAMTYEQLLELEEQIGNVPKGLTQYQINQLPEQVLGPDNIPDDKCMVCLYEFKTEEKIKQLPCKHNYHSNCIDNWLQKNKQCPLCKTEIIIEDDDQQNENENENLDEDQDNEEDEDQQEYGQEQEPDDLEEQDQQSSIE